MRIETIEKMGYREEEDRNKEIRERVKKQRVKKTTPIRRERGISKLKEKVKKWRGRKKGKIER